MNSRLALILIAAIFVLPAAIAWMFHVGVFDTDFGTDAGKNRGELVHPAKPLEGLSLTSAEGKPVVIDSFMGVWTMLEIASNPCEGDCGKNVYKMRQVRLALGKDAYRVQRALVAESGSALDKLMADNPGTGLFFLNDRSAEFLQQFPGYNEGGIPLIAGRIYIIDPLGNLMMRYPPDADPSDILKDLRQLLKATWIRPVT